jgi:hypothetical protein
MAYYLRGTPNFLLVWPLDKIPAQVTVPIACGAMRRSAKCLCQLGAIPFARSRDCQLAVWWHSDTFVSRPQITNTCFCLTWIDMTKTIPLLASLVLLVLASPVVAADSRHPASDAPAAADDKAKQAEPAECPITKPIDGKTYCFQNDPALTKRQGGG